MTWEERWHPLREEWVVVAAHRQDRPWSGSVVAAPRATPPTYAADCYLCPGNRRVSGQTNPAYSGVYTFDNDHPCVGPLAPSEPAAPVGFYKVQSAQGLARVVCYTPRHDLSLGSLSHAEMLALFVEWQAQYRELAARPEVRSVLLFENRGEAVGVSSPHPHCQIYATNFVFRAIEVEVDASRRHLAATGRHLFQDIIQAEREDGRRILAENAGAIAFLPYFARYSYETYVAPKRSVASLADLELSELRDLVSVLKDVLNRFDALWSMPFPYVMTLRQAPTDGGDYSAYHFHVQFQPPLRKPHLLKFLAGPETGGGNFVSDTAPEEKAAELRAAGGGVGNPSFVP